MKPVYVLLLVLAFSSCVQNLSNENEYEARVVKVVDGDTFYAEIDGKTIKVRILGIDAPELKAERNKPYEYGEITNLTCLAEWGKKAKSYLRDKIEGKTVLLVIEGRDKYGRYLSYVYRDSVDLAEEMLKLGYARVFVSEFEKLEEYLKYQNSAIEMRAGLWSCN